MTLPHGRHARDTNLVFHPQPTTSSSRPVATSSLLVNTSEAAPEDVRKFRDVFNQRNAEAAQAAAEVRQSQSRSGNSAIVSQLNQQIADTQLAALQRTLRERVTAAYEARSQLQTAEVNWLRQRLTRIEQQLEDRGRHKDQIIDRRIEELLNPGIQWDPNLAATNEPTNTQTTPATNIASLAKEDDNRNNLHQLARAMHNYHDTFSHFPKAVTIAREVGGKTDTPHSWRIDLLPFIGAANLYQQYNMDEPWDGPNNKKLLQLMPAVFRSPYDDPKSTSTAYAVLVGKGTVFEPRSEGVKIREITDGTSNTILVVEARRNCPWMKPEDIPFDADKPVPELGGFVEGKFAAATADGHVSTFERSKVEDILKWMIQRNDGTSIRIPRE